MPLHPVHRVGARSTGMRRNHMRLPRNCWELRRLGNYGFKEVNRHFPSGLPLDFKIA